MGRKRKQPTRKLSSDQEYIDAFTRRPDPGAKAGSEDPRLNRHGLPIVDEIPFSPEPEPGDEEEDFSSLLEESFSRRELPRKPKPSPMPYKKRIKRYPPPETELDLHGYTALGAEVKAKSFLITSKQQGYFTVRLIVGKGLHSDLGPVLPDVIEDLLNALKKQDVVLGFEWDRKKKIRSGAVIVYLRQFSD